ncbi:MAG: DNA replication and repair protein RecF [Proteobacteria bacterium]|nr:DNA replication and repair protein RecF [Pseudomonadota bacterium]
MIEALTLTDFRNHARTRIKSAGHRNIIITGGNGGGKTAVLEAVSMFGGNGGLRGATMAEVARDTGAGGFAVSAELADGTTLSVAWSAGDACRRARIDNDAAAISDCARYLRMVWITPREDRLFLDGASERRAFFDRLTASFAPAHAGRTARLAKLLSERAFALKNGSDHNWLCPIEKHLAETAVAVAGARVKYAGEINHELSKPESPEPKVANSATDSGSRLSAFVTLSGWLEDRLAAGIAAADAEREYLEYLANNRELIADKMSAEGAHKSDFGMFDSRLNKRASMASTGQQKMMMMGLIIAHARLIKTKTGMSPVILLDEAAAHLDAAARAKLFAELGDMSAQVWATGLERAVFGDVPDALFITCVNGTVVGH